MSLPRDTCLPFVTDLKPCNLTLIVFVIKFQSNLFPFGAFEI